MKTPHPAIIGNSLLAGIVVRLNRAGEHLSDVKMRLERLSQRNVDQIIDEGDSEIMNIMQFRYPHDRYPMLPVNDVLMISVVVGEVIYNLRSSLDYLIYGLAWIDSRSFQKMTQFPIYILQRGF